jgi:hypothetical protein
MPDSDDIKSALIENATGPARVTGDEASVEQHSLPDQIAAHKYTKQQEAIADTAGVGGGIRMFKMNSPGAV